MPSAGRKYVENYKVRVVIFTISQQLFLAKCTGPKKKKKRKTHQSSILQSVQTSLGRSCPDVLEHLPPTFSAGTGIHVGLYTNSRFHPVNLPTEYLRTD